MQKATHQRFSGRWPARSGSGPRKRGRPEKKPGRGRWSEAMPGRQGDSCSCTTSRSMHCVLTPQPIVTQPRHRKQTRVTLICGGQETPHLGRFARIAIALICTKIVRPDWLSFGKYVQALLRNDTFSVRRPPFCNRACRSRVVGNLGNCEEQLARQLVPRPLNALSPKRKLARPYTPPLYPVGSSEGISTFFDEPIR